MTEQLHWEDVQVGAEIPALVKKPTLQQLVRYAGASGDFSRIHYDEARAKGQGFPSVIVHGTLQLAFVAQMLTDWIGEDGRVRRLECAYRRVALANDTLTCKGIVKGKHVQEGVQYIECDVWIENEACEVTARGTASAVLPTTKKTEGNGGGE